MLGRRLGQDARSQGVDRKAASTAVSAPSVYDSKYGDAWNGTIFTTRHDFSTAEFILEDPPGKNLINFSYLTYHNAYVNGTGSAHEVGMYPNARIDMYLGTDLQAQPGSLSNSDPVFRDNYIRCN